MSRSKIKKFIAFLTLLSLLFSLCISVAAVDPLPDTSKAKSVYLWNAEYDEIILSRSQEDVIFPASMTKIMTGLVAIDLIGGRLDETVTLTSAMLADRKGTSMQLKVGEVVSYRDLLYGAICGGFNDAATALAVSSAGSMAEFVKKMNEKAEALGAKKTFYTNPTGWHNDAMVTTLEDTVIIAKAAMQNELYVKVSSSPSYVVKATNVSSDFTVNNRNGLIGSHYAHGYYNRRAMGLIAGMTDEGGHCVATFFEDSGLTYLCIVMGAEELNEKIYSYTIANDLISYVVRYYGEVRAIKAGELITKAPVSLAASNSGDEQYMLNCVVDSDVNVITPYDSASLESIELRSYLLKDELTAPIKEGEIVGGVDIFVDGVLRGHAELHAANDVEANGFLVAMSNAKKMLSSRAFIISFVVFAVLFSLYFFFFELKNFQKREQKIKFDRLY